jgi:hypothetical protein
MLIHDTTPDELLFDPRFGRGLIPRDKSSEPPEMFASPDEIPVVDPSEWDARIDEQEQNESSLEHVWLRSGKMPLDQNGFPYCWAHSSVHGVMGVLVRDHVQFPDLSAVGLASKIMNGAQKGGWCGLSSKYIEDHGIPLQSDWSQHDASMRNDNPGVWERAAKYKITQRYVDLTAPHYYYQNLTMHQVAACLLLNIPVPMDFNWWGHSVCGMRWVRIEKGSYGVRILNSWYIAQGKPWGQNGFATLQGSRAKCDSATATRCVLAA